MSDDSPLAPDFVAIYAAKLAQPDPPEPASPTISIADTPGWSPHPICGHNAPKALHVEGTPCLACLYEVENTHLVRDRHPVCGCPKPTWAHRAEGPCDFCLRDVERDYRFAFP